MKIFTHTNGDAPIIFSFPHVGTYMPQELEGRMNDPYYKDVPDTDWFVHQVYDFHRELDIGSITAHYNRYFVDLNRNPSQKNLYSDNRLQTSIVPTNAFSGDPLYKQGEQPTEQEIQQRVKLAFEPYHQHLTDTIDRLKKKYKRVLLIDGHSINRSVPKIQSEPFPDMILGTVDGKSCDPDIQEIAWNVLEQSPYTCTLNKRFRGGHITRHFGKPEDGVNVFQIEMSQDIYMDMNSMQLSPTKAQKVQDVFRKITANILEILK